MVKNKNKIELIITVITLVLFLAVLILSINFLLTGNIISSTKNYSTYTKAICNENNFCQDYIFTCENDKVIEQTPITGAVMQFDENWVDPRSN